MSVPFGPILAETWNMDKIDRSGMAACYRTMAPLSLDMTRLLYNSHFVKLKSHFCQFCRMREVQLKGDVLDFRKLNSYHRRRRSANPDRGADLHVRGG